MSSCICFKNETNNLGLSSNLGEIVTIVSILVLAKLIETSCVIFSDPVIFLENLILSKISLFCKPIFLTTASKISSLDSKW